MERAITGRKAAEDEELLVHDWRVARLAQFGIPESLAEVYADHIDWHQVARLVQRGCPPRLALRIVRWWATAGYFGSSRSSHWEKNPPVSEQGGRQQQTVEDALAQQGRLDVHRCHPHALSAAQRCLPLVR
jgi:hypothetical protein